jgi:hypothetical protein
LTSWPFSFAGKISRGAGRNKKSVAAAWQLRFEQHSRIAAAQPSKFAVRCATMFTVLNMFN